MGCERTFLTTGSATGSWAGPAPWNYRADAQLSHHSEAEFIADLACVWKSVADACSPGAKLVCRFGALPSCRKDPRDLFGRSLSKADCGWRITTIRDAGTAHRGRRQCDQFRAAKNKPVEEIDVYAVLSSCHVRSGHATGDEKGHS